MLFELALKHQLNAYAPRGNSDRTDTSAKVRRDQTYGTKPYHVPCPVR
jgi:hypothetical protein